MQKTWFEAYQTVYKNKKCSPKTFHIGYHKTATTFIQKSILPQLEEDVRDSIFSNEGISGYCFEDNLNCGDLTKEINPDAKIIVTIRSQITMYPSYYWLYVKSGGTLSLSQFIDECLKQRRFDYHALYQSLTSIFDPEKIKIIPFELLKKNKEEFLNSYLNFALGSIPEGMDYNYKTTSNKNTSPKLLAVQIVLLANRVIRSQPKLKKLRSQLAKKTGWIEKLCLNSKKQVADAMNSKLQEKITQHYKESNQAIQKHLSYNLEELGYPL